MHIKNIAPGSTAGIPLEIQTRIDDNFLIFQVREYIIMPKAVLTRPKISAGIFRTKRRLKKTGRFRQAVR